MADLEDRLAELHRQERQVLAKMHRRDKNRKIKCGGCEDSHRTGDLIAIQTHWYTSPHGCTEGDYWSEGELQFVCPETGITNRLLFDNYDVPYENRKDFEHNPAEQFKIRYKSLFREVRDSYDEHTPGKWANNYYVDQHRKQFGLVEKRK